VSADHQVNVKKFLQCLPPQAFRAQPYAGSAIIVYRVSLHVSNMLKWDGVPALRPFSIIGCGRSLHWLRDQVRRLRHICQPCGSPLRRPPNNQVLAIVVETMPVTERCTLPGLLVSLTYRLTDQRPYFNSLLIYSSYYPNNVTTSRSLFNHTNFK
jgi:hypothetical protein